MSYPDELLTLPCGCEKDNGSWSPCAAHRKDPSAVEHLDRSARPAYPLADETAAEDCRNAATILAVAEPLEDGGRRLSVSEYAAILGRLDRAVAKLEQRAR